MAATGGSQKSVHATDLAAPCFASKSAIELAPLIVCLKRTVQSLSINYLMLEIMDAKWCQVLTSLPINWRERVESE